MGPNIRLTEVKSVQDISPHMRRIVLTGKELASFPLNKESAHIKAVFPDPNSVDKKPKTSFHFNLKKYMRSYTIRAFDRNKLALTIDFAVNDHNGLAANWASQAQPGDLLGIAGPGDVKHMDLFADNHIFIGDITALPAIAATFEKLPYNATGHAWIQVPSSQDIQEINVPAGIKVNWLVTENKLTNSFLKGLQSLGTNLENTAVFIAAEASVVKQLKAHLNDNCKYNKKKMYASAYWNKKK